MPVDDTPNRRTAAELRKELREAELDEDLSKMVASMNALTANEGTRNAWSLAAQGCPRFQQRTGNNLQSRSWSGEDTLPKDGEM